MIYPYFDEKKLFRLFAALLKIDAFLFRKIYCDISNWDD